MSYISPRILLRTPLRFKYLSTHPRPLTTRQISKSTSMPSYAEKDPERVVAGLKSAINNPNVSEKAKEHAAERLEDMDTEEAVNTAAGDHEFNHILGGYKATLHNDRTSEAAKRHATEVLEAAGYTVERGTGSTEDEHQNRVLAGYKSALHNPRVSEEAKEHAREYLKEHDAL